jgi:HemY protein
MAAIERGQGESDEVVRGWLARALGASRGPQWICGKCNHVHAAWAPVCENCGAFDTLDWRAPAHAEDARLADSAMLPLIIGTKPAPSGPARPAPTPPDVEDAELASAADQARAAGGG